MLMPFLRLKRAISSRMGAPRESAATLAARRGKQFRRESKPMAAPDCALDFDLANFGMVRVNGGYVVIDTGSSLESAGQIRRQFDNLAGGSPRAVNYTHSHVDHIGGADAFCDPGVPVIAHQQFAEELEIVQLLPAAYFNRGAKQYAAGLPIEQVAEDTIGPPYRLSDQPRPPIRLPTQLVDRITELTIGGVKFQLHSAPGETHDHLFVWLPEERILFAGDNIYRAFPNLYAIRGVPARPVRSWIDSLDAMRRLDPAPEVMVLGHTETVRGAATIHELLTVYRDAIARIHDNVVAGINAGRTPDELVEEITLPPDLRDHPYLSERYGTLRGSIRGIYSNYMGWFDGDAANLDPVTLKEVSANLLPVLGGTDGAYGKSPRPRRPASFAGRCGWCKPCWLLNRTTRRRKKKSELLDRLAVECFNPLMKNWLRSDADLLRGDSRLPPKPRINGATLAEMPVEQILRMMPSRLHPLRASGLTARIGFDFTDTGKQYTFIVRRGIGELAPGMSEPCAVVVRATEDAFRRYFVAADRKPTSAEFRRNVKFVAPAGGVFRQLGALRLLLRLRRCLIQP